ncbi:MAG TPA: PH domain-containing protein [Tepidisphaeraceae bacterium]|nr:PH domain-containing protein [Tepidisphaeraceae bacterium]
MTGNQPVADDQPHKTPSDAEEVYFEGSPPARGLGGKFLLWCLVGLIIVVVPVLLYRFAGVRFPVVVYFICIVVGLDLPVIPILMAKTKRYRITNYRIDYERGIFSKDIDTLELWHVDDIHFHQSLLDRILGVGSIHVESKDETMPDLWLRGIPHPRPLYETLKQRVIAVKRSRGVIKVDPG